MMRAKRVVVIGLVALGAALAPVVHAAPAGTEFTYQGELRLSGNSVTGPVDMIFTLWDAASFGNQVGSTLTFDGASGNPAPVAVVGGLFTATLDFGSTVFDGNARWLAISVRYPAGAGAYTNLAPRQKLTATPYAAYALNAPGSGLWSKSGSNTYNTTTGFVGINRSTTVTGAEYFGVQAPVNSGYGGMYIRTDGAGGQPFYGYSAGGAEVAWTYLDGATGDWIVYAGGDRLIVTDEGNVGIGDNTPDARLDVTTADGDAITGTTTAASSVGVYGSGTTAGVEGVSGASNGYGVYGHNNTTGGEGVRGSSSAAGAAGVAGYDNLGTGVYGQSTGGGYGIYGSNGGSNSTGYAGYFNGRVHVNGTLSKNGGAFKIDHPLDPANKYLLHSFVESPDMMNIYNGNVTLDEQGEALVQMPEWFEALNQEFRYQLTCIGGFAPVYVAEEILDNTFRIAGGQPGLKVSWQVTGIRHDPYAEQNRIQVEEQKSAAERGKYLHPELYDQPAELSLYPAHGSANAAEE